MSDARRSRIVRRPWASFVLFALVLAASAGGILILGSWAARGTGFERYSTYRAEPDGASACFETLQDLGFHCVRETEDLRGLPDDGSLLVLVGPFPRSDGPPAGTTAAPGPAAKPSPLAGLGAPMAQGEVDRILAWVKRGGRLLVLEGHENILYRALDVGVDGSPEPNQNLSFVGKPAAWSVYTASGARLELANRATLVPPTKGATWTTLWKDKDGAPVAIATALDKGEVVLFADPSLATNDGLRRGGNLEALYEVANGSPQDVRTIRFDELRHGFATTRNVMGYARRHGLHLAVVQGGLTFVLAVWAASRARRRPRGVLARSRIESREFVAAMANIYSRARLSEHAARGYLRRCVRALAISLGRWPATTPDDEVAARLREQGVRNFRGWESVRDEALLMGLVDELRAPAGSPEAPSPTLEDLAARSAGKAPTPPARVALNIKDRQLLAFARLSGNLEREVRAAGRISVDKLL